MNEIYKKHRPKTLEKVVGNESTVQTLQNMISRGTLPHTILLHGPSGCGKTTLARILKTALNCSDIDFKELNCSDFRGIDTIREIIRTMSMAPTGGECRIFLLDEVHQMSKDGQNAALKMLEDTPPHVYFILCTTDPQKIIKTIRTRCCELPVELLDSKKISILIKRIMKREGLELDQEIIQDISIASGGSARRALVILDRIANLPPEMREEAIKEDPQAKEVLELCRSLIKREPWKKIASILSDLKEDPESVRYAVLGYARSTLLKSSNSQAALVIDCFADNFYDSKEAGLVLACYNSIIGR